VKNSHFSPFFRVFGPFCNELGKFCNIAIEVSSHTLHMICHTTGFGGLKLFGYQANLPAIAGNYGKTRHAD